jgi:hypothetical protein
MVFCSLYSKRSFFVCTKERPRMLSKQAISEFQAICQEEFGVAVSDACALEQGVNLLTLMSHVYRPIRKEWHADFPVASDIPKAE